MADKPINLLPSSAGNMLSTDRFPVDKFAGGPYITIHRTGQQIMDAVTSLPTATFTNINTSLTNLQNNIIPTVYTNSKIIEVRSTGASFASGSSIFIILININSSMSLNRPYIINFKIYARCTGATIATKVKELNIVYVNKSTPEIIGTNSMYEYNDTNGASITIGNPSVISTNNIRISTSHSIATEFVATTVVATIYGV